MLVVICQALLVISIFPINCSSQEIVLQKQIPQEDTRNIVGQLPFAENLIGWRCIVPASLTKELNSKTSIVGQSVDCILKDNLAFGSTKLASKGSIVHGRIIDRASRRTLASAMVSSDRRYKSQACIAIEFEDIVDSETNQLLPIQGLLCKQKVVANDPQNKRREVVIDSQGRIVKAERTFSTAKKTTFNVIRATTILPLPGGLAINIAAGPVIMGTAGAISPSFAYNKPIDDDMPHKRIKGFTYGFITGLPGAFIVQACVEKGDEVIVRPSDELALDIRLLDPRTQKLASTDVTARLFPVATQTESKFLPAEIPSVLKQRSIAPTNNAL